MKNAVVAAGLLVITALSFFVFPGHTYLNQDTQIYVPILEHQLDPSLLNNDPVVAHPHVGFTFYDELTTGLRRLTGAPLEMVLKTEQFVFRALGLWGVFLIALALGADAGWALVAAAVAALGATITGPAVLAVEVEPVPRAFAVPLLLAACGLLMHRRYAWCAVVAACAVFLHAPAAWPLVLVCLVAALRDRRALWPTAAMIAAAIVLYFVGKAQAVGEPQDLFGRIPAAQEMLQRMRAPYNWVSTWDASWFAHYAVVGAFAAAALWRLRQGAQELWVLLGAGTLSVPLSLLMLEGLHLALTPQIQPARALLFFPVVAVTAGVVAASRSGSVERFAWLASALWIPVGATIWEVTGVRVVLVVLLAAALIAFAHRAFAIALPAIYLWGAGIATTRVVDTKGLPELSAWANASTSKDAVFAFPYAGHGHQPGWFRAVAQRAVLVDWKSGGQVNYLRKFGDLWWLHWRSTMTGPVSDETLRAFGADYVVTQGAAGNWTARQLAPLTTVKPRP